MSDRAWLIVNLVVLAVLVPLVVWSWVWVDRRYR